VRVKIAGISLKQRSGGVFLTKVFICHASEDKEAIAKPLAEILTSLGFTVWYDQFTLRLGDSLLSSISRGLSESQYGIVILSPSFFSKKWPQFELNGLFAKEIAGDKTILPVWHQITLQEILEHSPILADKVGVKTTEGLTEVVKRIVDAIDTEGFASISMRMLKVDPARVELSRGEYVVNNIVTVSNLNDRPVYWPMIKLTLEPKGLDFRSVSVNVDGRNKLLDQTMIPYQISTEKAIWEIIDNQDMNAKVVGFHHIDPKSSRHISIAGSPPIAGYVNVRVWNFSLDPRQTLSRGNEVVFPFKAPEPIKLKGIGVFFTGVDGK
jgi:hypothetical protein